MGTPQDNRQAVRFRSVATACGAAVAGLGLLGLVSWLSGVRVLSSVLPGYIPMSPSTAYSFLLLGAILTYQVRTRLSPRNRGVAVVLALLVACFGLLSFIELFVSVDLNMEDLLFPTAEHFGEVLTNRISPLTGLTLLLGGTSLLVILRPKDQGIRRHLAGFLGCLVTIIGAIATLGYIFATPLLYGGVVIPMALTTSVAFLLLGVGLVAGTGPDALPLRIVVGPSTQARLLRAFLPMTVAVVMVQGLLHRFIPALFHNYALGAALLALSFSLITGMLVVVVGRTMGQAMDLALEKRKGAEEALQLSDRRKAILNRISLVFLTIPDQEMYAEVLEVVREETESRFGVFGFIADNGDLVIPSMTREIWGECQIPDKSIIFPADAWGHSLWGKAIREQKAFYSDGPFTIPAGHIRIDNFLTAPIVFGNKTLGVISVANRLRKYTDEDKDLLEGITSFVSPILNARLQRDRQEHQRKQGEEEIIRQREELRGLAARLAEVEEVERQNLARELHDQVCQNLTSINIALETIMIRAGREPLDQLKSRLAAVGAVAEQTNEITRNIMEGLRPTVLDHYGLMGGVSQLGSQFSQRTGIAVEVRGKESAPRLPASVELALFRITQEALANVAKHSGATQVTVYYEDGEGTCRLTISDNGIGFDQDKAASSTTGHKWGMITMNERAMAVEGTCRIDSQPGQGTRVVIEVPR